jgi:serine/threonine-protein kinase
VTVAPSWRDRLRHLHRRIVAQRRGRIGLVAALAAIAVLIAGGGWWFSVGRYTAAPGFDAMTKAAAVQKAQQAGFELKYDGGRYDEKIPKDTVLGQQPAPGARILKGGTIVLTLSLGPERYQVPDVVGKAYDLAVVDLQQRKLVPVPKHVYDDNMPAGNVLAVDPAVNTEVKPNTKITVTVSRGKAPLTVPNVIGRHIDEARSVLQGMGLLVDVEEKESDKPQGQVIGQTPNEGAGLEPGAKIKLTVSKGPQMVVMPAVKGRPCQEGKAALEQLQLRVNLQGANPNGTIAEQNPPENTPIPPGTEVMIWCF